MKKAKSKAFSRLTIAVVITMLCAMPFCQTLVSATTGTNLVDDGKFDSFLSTPISDIAMPTFPTFNEYGMSSYMTDGNSAGIITKSDNNSSLKLSYDGTSAGTNTNTWMFQSTLKAGAGTYKYAFDIKSDTFSTGDYFGFDLIGADGTKNISGVPLIFGATDYTGVTNLSYSYDSLPPACPFAITVTDSTVNTGWKHFEVTVPENADQGNNIDTIAFQFFNKKDANLKAYIDNVSVKKDGGAELFATTAGYLGDFEMYYENSVTLSKTGLTSGYGCAFAQDSAPVIIKDNDNKVMKMAFDGETGHNYSSFYKFLELDGMGKYKVEFDIKYPAALNTNDIGFHFAGAAAVSANYPVATSVAGLNSLPNSEALTGYKHFETEIEIDDFTANYVDSLAMWFNTNGLSAADNWIMIDNINVEKTVDKVTESEPSVTGKVLSPMVMGGGFEQSDSSVFIPGFTFPGIPTNETFYWGTASGDTWYDSPAQIVSTTGANGSATQAMMLSYDGHNTTPFSSAFVLLNSSRLNIDDVYEFSFDYKSELQTDAFMDPALHVEFLDSTGHEYQKMYINTADDNDVTNEIGSKVYDYDVTDYGNGWKNVTMRIKLDSNFVSNVDSFRFLLDTKSNAANKAYFDNVKFGVYTDPNAPVVPGTNGDVVNDPINNGTQGSDNTSPKTGNSSNVDLTAIICAVAAIICGACIASKYVTLKNR